MYVEVRLLVDECLLSAFTFHTQQCSIGVDKWQCANPKKIGAMSLEKLICIYFLHILMYLLK